MLIFNLFVMGNQGFNKHFRTNRGATTKEAIGISVTFFPSAKPDFSWNLSLFAMYLDFSVRGFPRGKFFSVMLSRMLRLFSHYTSEQTSSILSLKILLIEQDSCSMFCELVQFSFTANETNFFISACSSTYFGKVQIYVRNSLFL